MLTIPTTPKGYGPWNFQCRGSGAKFLKNFIAEVSKRVLINEKIKSKHAIFELYLKTEEEIKEINNKFRKKDEPTDVIAIQFIENFDYEITFPTVLGSAFFCWPIIKEDAKNLNKNEFFHLAHIVVHACLHILGYDHTTEIEKQSMEAKEIIILSKLGIQNPYL